MIRHCETCGEVIQKISRSWASYAKARFCKKACSFGGNEADREVVALLRSVPDFEPMSFEEIAELCGITAQRVEQIESCALDKLRRTLKTNPDLANAFFSQKEANPCATTHS